MADVLYGLLLERRDALEVVGRRALRLPLVRTMTLLVDDRIGSAHLAEPLRALGLDVDVSRLTCGDVAILGPDGGCGVELKALGDAVRCMRDGRAAEQLLVMRRSYAVSYLVVEGNYRCGPGGAIEVPIGGYWDTPGWARHASYRGLKKWIISLELNGGARVRETKYSADTLAFIAALAEWWQEGRAAHSSHIAINTSYANLTGDEWVAMGPQASRAVLMAKELPGLGKERAKAAVEHFGGATLREKLQRLLDADKKQWIAVPGVGKVTAKEVLAALEAPE